MLDPQQGPVEVCLHRDGRVSYPCRPCSTPESYKLSALSVLALNFQGQLPESDKLGLLVVQSNG
jgi:hypothetical protein